MKKSISTAIILAAALLSVQSCRFIRINDSAFNEAGAFVFNGSGTFVEPSAEWQVLAYTVDDFSAIRSTIPMDITYEMNADSSFVEIFAPENYLEYMEFKTVEGCLNAEFSEPLRTRADGNYVTILYEDNGKLVRFALRNTLKAIEGLSNSLIRTHRSYYVNLHHIKLLQKDTSGVFAEIDIPGVAPIPISKNYAADVAQQFSTQA